MELLEPRRLLAADLQWQPLGEPGSGGRMDAITVSPHDPDRVLIAGDILGTGLSVDGGQTWRPTTGWQSWEHSDLTFHPSDPDIVWAGTNSGPHLSSDGGETWTSKRDGLPPAGFGYPASVETVLFDAGDPTNQTLLAVGGDHRRFKDGESPDQVPNYVKIWRSRDAGESWNEIGQIPTGLSSVESNIMAATFGGNSHEVLWAAVAESGVWRSNNDGEAGTWQPFNTGLPTLGDNVRITGLVAHPMIPELLHVTIGSAQGINDRRDNVGGVFRTTDAGQNWTRVEDGDADGFWPSDFKHIAASLDGNTLWAVDNHWGDGMGAYRSSDAGVTWEHVLTQSNVDAKLVDSTPFDSGIVNGWWAEVSPHDGDVVFVGSSTSVLVTRDGGETWEDVLNTPVAGGHRSSGYTGWVANNAEFNPFNGDQLVVQGWDRLLASVSDDGGFSYEMTQPGLPRFGGGNDIAFAVDGTMFASLGQSATNDQIARSTDGGVTWQVLTSPSSEPGRAWSVHVNKDNANEAWAVVGDNFYRSTNALAVANEVSWQAIDVDGHDVNGLEPVPDRQDNFYLTTDAGIYYTSNGGDSFDALGGPTVRVSLGVDASSPNVVYAASNDIFGSPGFFRYDRFGSDEWTQLPLPDEAAGFASVIAVDPTNSNRIAIGTKQDPYVDVSGATGVWLSEDGGDSWTQHVDNLPMLRINSLTFSPDGSRLIAGTGGRGFFAAEVNDSLRIEAEHMVLGGLGRKSFVLENDGEADGGRYLVAPSSVGDNYSNGDAPVLTYTFTLKEPANDVQLRGRVRTPTGDLGDSFWVRANDGPWQLWDTPQSSDDWTWGTVRNRGDSVDYTIDLPAGRHTVEFKVRETGTQLDAIEVLTSPPVLVGDANGDGRVDLADFGIVRTNFGRSLFDGGASGDFNGDGIVNLADFGLLRSNFGATLPALA